MSFQVHCPNKLSMFSLLVWNIRGVANASSKRSIKYLMKSHKLSLIAILEPKSSSMTIAELQAYLNGTGCLSNNAGSIWVIWNANLQCQTLSSDDQQITLSCTYFGQNFVLSCVYASCNSLNRKALWSSL